MNLRMKKIMSLILSACVLGTAFTTPVHAAESQSQEISAVLTAEPSYTVTIPAAVTMGNEGTFVDVSASDVKNLPEGKKISVTIAGTDYYRNQMVLEADTSPRTSIRYQIISESGETIETTGEKDQANGKEIVAFTEDGTKQYQILPVIAGRFEYGVPYTGSITFGIEVTE